MKQLFTCLLALACVLGVSAESGSYSLFGFSTGMSYRDIKAKAAANQLEVVKDEAGLVEMVAKNAVQPHRPIIITALLASDDRAKEIRVQEANGTDDVDIVAVANKQWGRPTGSRNSGSLSPTMIWGNEKGLHAEGENQLYNQYLGCVCVRILDPSMGRNDAQNKGVGHGSPIPDESVTGFHLGSSYSAAVAELTGQGYTAKNFRFPWPDQTAAALQKQDGSRNTEVYFLQAVGGNLLEIKHEMHFETGRGPTVTETIAGLRSKYGRTSADRIPMDQGQNGFYELTWLFDDKGRPEPQAEVDCSTQNLAAITINEPRAGSQVLRQTAPNCARGAKADINFDPQSSQITAMTIDLYDFRTFNALIAAKASALHAEQVRLAPKPIKPPL